MSYNYARRLERIYQRDAEMSDALEDLREQIEARMDEVLSTAVCARCGDSTEILFETKDLFCNRLPIMRIVPCGCKGENLSG